MIRRAFVRALSGAILTTLLGVKAWRLEASEADPDIAVHYTEDDGIAFARFAMALAAARVTLPESRP